MHHYLEFQFITMRKLGYKELIEQEYDEDEKKEYRKVVVNLEEHINDWLKNNDPRDNFRIITGGPGSGKSSFVKIFAACTSQENVIPVILIELYRFDVTIEMVMAVGKYISRYTCLNHNPLDEKGSDNKLLIIFDGLDELAMQGKTALDVAQKFIAEVYRNIYIEGIKLKVLISGREMVVQFQESDFRNKGEILYVLPYYVPSEKRQNYVDINNLLEIDRRRNWWSLYGRASGKGFTEMPEKLNSDKLVEITSQPLLNYLAALSFDSWGSDFSLESNLNNLYSKLIKKVYDRDWAQCRHPALHGITEDFFYRFLEEIAVSAWHGTGKSTTIEQITSHCENMGVVKSFLKVFKEEKMVGGVTRLLTAFYFRGSGFSVNETFEFTHKSFGEYLTAKRIVRTIKKIHKKIEQHETDYDDGWDEKDR